MTTIYVTHPRYDEHELQGHPERPERIREVWRQLDETGLSARMQRKMASLASEDMLRLVHTPAYVELLKRTAGHERMFLLDADTYAGPTSYEIACLSAGGVVDAVDAVMKGEAANGLAAVRPPGHHAMPDRGMGFCILGNVAIAARHAQQQYGIERVLIYDYDVHHGNGTEAMFYDDPSVLFISLHQWPLYPGTGTLTDTGRGAGKGATINVPMPPDNGDVNYAAVMEQVVWPAARRFQPELILISVGHDAHWLDPVARVRMRLTLTGYAHLARESIRMAEELCGGKTVFVMEGGYDANVLGLGMTNIARALLGDAEVNDPLGSPDDDVPEPDISTLIARVRQLHGLT